MSFTIWDVVVGVVGEVGVAVVGDVGTVGVVGVVGDVGAVQAASASDSTIRPLTNDKTILFFIIHLFSAHSVWLVL